MTAVLPHRWTIAGYRQLDKTGLFTDRMTMLLNGEIFVSSMPSPPHDTALNFADAYLRKVVPADHHVRNQQAFDIGTANDPGPDLAVVPGSIRDYVAKTPTAAALIVQVSVTSISTDMTTKAELYASAGVPEYWIVDVEARRLFVFRSPVSNPIGLGEEAYADRRSFGVDAAVATLFSPSVTIKVSELLP